MVYPLILPLLASVLVSGGDAPRLPMPTDYTNSIKTRWLNKPVLASRMLDDAEDLSTWKLSNSGQGRGELTLSKERVFSGSSSVRLTSPTTGDKPIPRTGYYGAADAVRVVAGEDWSDWNRISVWIYPDLPGFRVVSLMLILRNEGSEPVPDVYGKMGVNYVLLQNHRWNRIVWEIANLPRDKVTGLVFSYRMQGNEPGATDRVTFYIDKLELERVKPDHYYGWNVAPGEISFSHSGYQTGSSKIAIASDLEAAGFELINVESGVPVLSKRISEVSSHIGRFQVMDFSEIRSPGTYILRAGDRTTRPFRIGDAIWKPSIWKAINFFYSERCGYAVPGVHDVCHRDWLLIHGDRRLIVNGGWHDAGDLSQSLINTAEVAYGMFSLAERLQARQEDPALLSRLLEEASWGLDWLLKTAFHDGYRPAFCNMDRWTNGILGDVDDMICEAAHSPAGNFSAAATEALAARVLRHSDPLRAAYSLKQAVEDWEFGLAGYEKQPQGSLTELSGQAALASLELYETTGERRYAEKAQQFARTILNSQERNFLLGSLYPITGFFYTGPDRSRVLRYNHLSREASVVVPLVRLCELFPDHPEWMSWYAAVTLYSDYYQKAMAAFSQPYAMLANSVYHDEDYKNPPRSRGATPETYRAQVLAGVKVAAHHYVRLFPVWFGARGNHGTILSQAKGLSAVAHLRNNRDLAALAEAQLHWVVGRNPFVQSTMWGEGYDYAPQYSAMSGDIVGSLPVGIQTRGNTDVPYWPTENCHTWKEVWVLPGARWFWLMRDLLGPALVSGEVPAGAQEPVTFREVRSGWQTSVRPDPASSRFQLNLPEGQYEIRHRARRVNLSVLPGGTYSLDLRRLHFVDLEWLAQEESAGLVSLQAGVQGAGPHTLVARAYNLQITEPVRRIELKPGSPQKLVFQGKIRVAGSPWIVVLTADNDPRVRIEATGWKASK